MECAGRASRTPCVGPATRCCHRCRVVAYCSVAHQVSHRSVHKRECARLEQQMKRADILNEFPFTFTEEARHIQENRCSFLSRLGIHRLGMWTCECNCGVSAVSFNSRLIDSWNLPSDQCPCKANYLEGLLPMEVHPSFFSCCFTSSLASHGILGYSALNSELLASSNWG